MPFAFQNAPKPLLEAHSVTAHHLVAVVAAIRRCLACAHGTLVRWMCCAPSQVSELGLGEAVLVVQGHTAVMVRARCLDPGHLATIYRNYFCCCFFPYCYLLLG